MLAMVACGCYGTVAEAAKALVKTKATVKPTAELTALYNERYDKFKQIYPTCKELFGRLSE